MRRAERRCGCDGESDGVDERVTGKGGGKEMGRWWVVM